MFEATKAALKGLTMEDELRIALVLLLDCVDYKNGACRINEMVGAVLPEEILDRVKDVSNRAKHVSRN